MRQKQIKAVLFGCAGTSLTPQEKDFFKAVNPLGLILFDRNIQNPDQVKALTDAFRACVERQDAPVLVDQEGGRVSRLWPPYWTAFGWARTLGDIYASEPKKALKFVENQAKTFAKELLSVGIDVDCWPCLDVASSQTHEIMAKRCFSDHPEIVLALANAAVQTMLQHGLMPVVKHVPGYGRAIVDPHRDLPVVPDGLEVLNFDFQPFQSLSKPVWGMTAHMIYEALDKTRPATLSPIVLSYIREQIGFKGFLISDDISMGALKNYGTVAEVSRQAVEAGCDAVLHCNGVFSQMQEVACSVPDLSQTALNRLKTAEQLRNNNG